MKIAVEGCCHGHLDEIYGSLKLLEQRENCKIDLLLICGDFQAVRNPGDMRCMSVPLKYQKLGSFWKYYSGKAKAPYLTIFIGGNHEASNHLWELYHGGWVCENIYYLGHAGVVNFKGIRIGGASGIFKQHDYGTGHYERYPYNPSDLRSIYHVREYDVRKLLQIRKPMDVFLSHDWPRSIEHCGDLDQLLRKKRVEELATKINTQIRSGTIGSLPNKELLLKLKPHYWFAAHLHVHYPAVVDHAKSEQELKPGDGNATEGVTKFLSLDKCLPHRQFLQVVDVPTPETGSSEDLKYDLEWLAITKALHPYLSLNREATPLPTDEEMQSMIEQELMFLGMQEDMDELDLTIPKNFVATCDVHSKTYQPAVNPQTAAFCQLLGIENKINADVPAVSAPPPTAQNSAETVAEPEELANQAPPEDKEDASEEQQEQQEQAESILNDTDEEDGHSPTKKQKLDVDEEEVPLS